MKKTKHKILSIILSVVMVATFLPMGGLNTVFAADPLDVTTTGLDLSGGSVPLIQTTYQAGEGTIVWNPTTKTITGTGEEILSGGTIILNNATINTKMSGITLPTLFESKTADFSIVLNGSNKISTSNIGITYHQGSGVVPKLLAISQGEDGASLQIQAYQAGIFLPCPVVISSGTLSITADTSNGIVTTGENSDITISSGTVSVLSKESNALAAFGAGVIINGGNVTLSGKKSIQAATRVDLMWSPKIDTTDNIAIMGSIPPSLNDIFSKTDTVTGTVNDVKVEILNSSGAVLKTYNMDGTINIPKVIVDGVEYDVYDDITKKGIDLAGPEEPPFPVAFQAGYGYVCYNPATATLTLYDATIDTPASYPLINLPLKDVKIKLFGQNFLANTSGDRDITTTLIEQGGSYDPVGARNKQTPKDYSLTVSGTGILTAISAPSLDSISTLGTFIMESGTIRNDAGMSPFNLNVIDFQMRGGSIVSSYLGIYGDASITGGTILNTRAIQVLGNLTMNGGNVKCSSDMSKGINVRGTIKKTGGVLNSLVSYVELTTATAMKITFTLYDDVVAGRYDSEGVLIDAPIMKVGVSEADDFCLNIPKDKTLTFPVYSKFNIEIPVGESLSNYITNNGTFINNGQILLPAEATKDDVMEVVRVLKPKGAGMIVIGHDEKFYTNSGDEMTIITTDIDLSDGATATHDGYSFTGNDTDGYTLTLNNLALVGNLILPSNVPVTIQTNAPSVIDGGIDFAGGYACNLTFTGSAPIVIYRDISGATNGDVVNVQNGANVTVNGRIGIGGSGGAGGTLNVNGTRTTLSVFSDMSTAVYCGNLNVQNGANMITNASSRGINVYGGDVNVTKGSTLTTNCDYGVYIIDGKLNVDETSKLITNGAIAAFCIVDKTKAKTQNQVVSLPGLPTGTAIASAIGTDDGYGYTYWSLIPTGGSLAVFDENSEPVFLEGAAIGRYVFQRATSINSGGGSGGGTTGEPETPTTPTTPEKPKPIIPKPNPQTGDSIPAALPIMSIVALTLMALGLRLKGKEE